MVRPRTRAGGWAFGVATLGLVALLVALVTELTAGPFDTCPSPIYTTGQNIVFAALLGAIGALVIGARLAFIGKLHRYDVMAIAILYAVSTAALIAAVALYGMHASFECP